MDQGNQSNVNCNYVCDGDFWRRELDQEMCESIYAKFSWLKYNDQIWYEIGLNPILTFVNQKN